MVVQEKAVIQQQHSPSQEQEDEDEVEPEGSTVEVRNSRTEEETEEVDLMRQVLNFSLKFALSNNYISL